MRKYPLFKNRKQEGKDGRIPFGVSIFGLIYMYTDIYNHVNIYSGSDSKFKLISKQFPDTKCIKYNICE